MLTGLRLWRLSGRLMRLAAPAALAGLLLTGCGGGGSSAPPSPQSVTLSSPATGSNVAAVSIRQLQSAPSITANTPYVDVKVCDASGNCQTIPDVMVDTGSAGLRLFANKVALNLPGIASGGGTLAACAQFASGYAWGSMHLATVQIGGEITTTAIPVQFMNDPTLPAAPSTCAAQGIDFATRFSPVANGILGISNFIHDCGAGCTAATPAADRPAMYYRCASGACSQTSAELSQQGANPISAFAVDNNGSILTLPDVAPGGAASATGTLVFGIGTQSNNALPAGAEIFPIGQDAYIDGRIDGVMGRGFIDSGSNGYFLDLDPSVARCTPNAAFSWYCPSSPVALTVQLSGASSAQTLVIGNAQTMFDQQFTALPALGGTAAIAQFADLGLPFFYGRPIATGLENSSNPSAPYGYWAF
ncbi:MAG: DUF3443 domain-containing protein [Betaproteobacteria bacterium]|nr:DUF3443 domain-containing protein [Betaproteobacteria bacterium]MDE2270007.1 DUF3443 domain-containing protein [Betaproteobacteria bacterium]